MQNGVRGSDSGTIESSPQPSPPLDASPSGGGDDDCDTSLAAASTSALDAATMTAGAPGSVVSGRCANPQGCTRYDGDAVHKHRRAMLALYNVPVTPQILKTPSRKARNSGSGSGVPGDALPSPAPSPMLAPLPPPALARLDLSIDTCGGDGRGHDSGATTDYASSVDCSSVGSPLPSPIFSPLSPPLYSFRHTAGGDDDVSAVAAVPETDFAGDELSLSLRQSYSRLEPLSLGDAALPLSSPTMSPRGGEQQAVKGQGSDVAASDGGASRKRHHRRHRKPAGGSAPAGATVEGAY